MSRRRTAASPEKVNLAQSIIDRADAEGRALTEREVNQVDSLLDEVESATPRGRRSGPETIADELTNRVQTRFLGNADRAGMWGWESSGQWLGAVREAGQPGGSTDKVRQRLQNAPTTYGTEAVGPDGAFAVPPDFRSEILRKVTGEESLLPRCDVVPTNFNAITFPKDEAAPWGTGGIQAYWTGEAQQMTQSKPQLEKSTINTDKVTALVPVTDELLEDAPALGTFVSSKGGDVIDFKVTDAIINGTGVGMPLGILNSPCTVQVSKESSQVADTIHGLNLVKMWARMPAAWRKQAVWLVHPDAEPQLMQAGLQIKSPDGATVVGGSLAWVPANTIANQPFAALFGRPVIPTQSCQALGDVGDIIFASLSQYCALVKNPGIRADTSIHIWFDYGITAFRFTLRMGGQPWWAAPLTAKNGSTTFSPFVTLQSR